MNRFSCLASFFLFQIINPFLLSAECRFGLLVPITGEYASGGEECIAGYNVAKSRNDPKKLPIKFILEDSKAQAKESVTLFKKLVEIDQVHAVELMRSPVGMAVNPLSKSLKIPVIGAVGHPGFVVGNPFAYQFWPSTFDESKALAKQIISDDVKSIYSLTTEDDWLLAFQDDLVKNYQGLGGKIIASQNIEPTFNDFRSLILKIKQSKANAVFMGLAPNQLAIFIKQFREAGMKQTLYSTFNVKYEDVVKALTKELLNNITFVEVDSLKPKFMEQYKIFSKDRIPSAASYSCYLTTEALYQACEQSINQKEDLLNVLSKMTAVDTLDQVIEVKDRRAKFDILTKKFVDGDVEVVE